MASSTSGTNIGFLSSSHFFHLLTKAEFSFRNVLILWLYTLDDGLSGKGQLHTLCSFLCINNLIQLQDVTFKAYISHSVYVLKEYFL